MDRTLYLEQDVVQRAIASYVRSVGGFGATAADVSLFHDAARNVLVAAVRVQVPDPSIVPAGRRRQERPSA